MASTSNPLSRFMLTSLQQRLLFTALNFNNPNPPSAQDGPFNIPPTQPDKHVDESSMLDYDYDFGGDSSFDFFFDDSAQTTAIGDLPGGPDAPKSESPENDSPDKRSHPDDEDAEEGASKRRESGEKIAKKPGRKPLTSEPSSKRKAQNRAAQRAFRDRKERHLKDLETKVEELEKASDAANNENSLLRAQLGNMTVELNEYKKRFASQAGNRTVPAQTSSRTFGNAVLNNLNDVNFQFEFPKFGSLPGPPQKASASPPGISPILKRHGSDHLSPTDKSANGGSPINPSNYSQIGLDTPAREDLANLSSNLLSSPLTNTNVTSASRSSVDSHFSINGGTATSSPSASSISNMGPSSSCGTSPEPSTQSPMTFKPLDTLTTIGEETSSQAAPNPGHFSSIDMNDIGWLASQNNFQFDPQLFGDYRESQESVLANTTFDDSFFNDAFGTDFITPYNVAPSPVTQRKNLVAQIDAAQNADDGVVNVENNLLACNTIWEKLQACPKVQNGDFDLDGLCSDLQKKAKCTGSGAVVNEMDFKNAMKKYLGKTDEDFSKCVGTTKLESP